MTPRAASWTIRSRRMGSPGGKFKAQRASSNWGRGHWVLLAGVGGEFAPLEDDDADCVEDGAGPAQEDDGPADDAPGDELAVGEALNGGDVGVVLEGPGDGDGDGADEETSDIDLAVDLGVVVVERFPDEGGALGDEEDAEGDHGGDGEAEEGGGGD